ncbi:MAG: hypothetical protein JXR76_09815 [Deltaproteobacteria bacterium]|nr:hypothetical protein [Deltaproteobacteria bacterium]
MSRKMSSLFISVVLAVALLGMNRTAGAQHEYGKASPEIATFDGLIFWTGWNGSFSDSYSPECETYNWFLFFGPEGVFAGLTSVGSNYSKVDVFAAINMFYGVSSNSKPALTWQEAATSYGITYSQGLDIVPNVVSIDFGVTFFRESPSALMLQPGIQFSMGGSFSVALVDIPFMPSVTLDNAVNISGQDTGFWPVVLWNIDAAVANPQGAIINELRQLQSSGATTYTAIHQAQMAQSLLPVFAAMNTSSGKTLDGTVTSATPGDYVGQYLANMNAASAPAHTIGAAANDVEAWLQSGDTEAPARIMADMPISKAIAVGAFRMIKTGVGCGFEAAYRHGYDQAVASGTRTEDTVYADCLVTRHCLIGDACNLEVTAEEAATWLPGTTAADFEGAEVHFDAAPSDYIEDGNAGQLVSDVFTDGVASYGFVRNEESSIVLGVTVPSATSPANNGMNLELCARKVIMYSLLEQENVTVVDGTLLSFTQFDPETLPETENPINFTHGFYTFEVAPAEPGGTVDIVLDLPTVLAPGYSWAKYSHTDSQWVDWGAVGNKKVIKPDGLAVSSDRFTVTLTITDNGPYDDDDTPGVISESSGAALFDVAFASVSADEYLAWAPNDTSSDTDFAIVIDTATDSSQSPLDTATDSSSAGVDTATDTSEGQGAIGNNDNDGCNCNTPGRQPNESMSLWALVVELL